MLESKRLFDVVVACVALVLASPLLLVLSVLIVADSRGPVFFCQVRLGKGRVPFRVWKFRTMVERDPEAIDQPAEAVVTAGRDPRVTRVGRLLRLTSLDESPQLVNVLCGEMSLVGPRPILPEQLEVVPEVFDARFKVRPGITGLAQVRGRRSLDWLEQLRCDVEYVQRRSLAFDLLIMLQTVRVVLTGAGIYGSREKNWRAYRKQ